jgi:hypothetical protein
MGNERGHTMRNIPKTKLILVLLILNLLACTTPPKTTPDLGSVVAQFPKMSVGDKWVTLEHDDEGGGSGKCTYKVINVESDGSFDISKVYESTKKEIFYNFDSSATGVHHILGIMFDPDGLQFPLFAGKVWRTETVSKSVDGDYFTYKSKYEVVEYTTVKTAVGIFEAFRIKGTIKNADSKWKGISIYWYAPAAKAIVKTTNTHIRGLKLIQMDLVE